MAVELTFSVTLDELPGIYEWINNNKNIKVKVEVKCKNTKT